MTIWNDDETLAHEAEVKKLKDLVKRLQSKLDHCVDYLETANRIIKQDRLSYDKEDYEDCKHMIESCRKLASETLE